MNAIITPEERNDIGRLMRLPIWKKARFAWGLRKDHRVNRAMTLPLVLAAAFVVLPVHVLPGWLPLRRRIENAVALAIGLFCFIKLAPPGLLREHLDETENSEST